MSAQGIRKAAEVFSLMQAARLELIAMGSQPGAIDKQDIYLGQMFAKANNAIRDDFARLTVDELPTRD